MKEDKEQIDYSKFNIYKKMLLATEKINKVAKNLNVNSGKIQYKAVGEVDVLNAVKPIEIECGIYSFPFKREVIDTNVLTTEKEFNGEVKRSSQLFMRLEVTYRFVNVDNPTEFIDVVTYGDGVDTQDKAPGKAMTYADKYALLKAYKIETGDDPDKEPSGELKGVERKETKATPKQVAMLLQHYQGDNLTKLLEVNKISKIEDIPLKKASEIIKKIMEKGKKENE